MNKQYKQLLLKDLCARLPYGVRVKQDETYIFTLKDISVELGIGDVWDEGENIPIENIKPYLRPMSSMTEEERKDLLVTIVGNEGVKYFQVLSDGSIDNTDAAHQDLHNFTMHWINFDKDTVTLYLDWLNRHHFDYRGLIEKGLALEATDGMYKEEHK